MKLFRTIILIISLGVTLFSIYTSIFGQITPVLQRSTHITLILLLVFLMYPLKKESKILRIVDYMIAAFALGAGIYLYSSYGSILLRVGAANIWDVVFGTGLVLIVLEACRRVVGWSLTSIAIIFLAYGFFGNYVPGFFGHIGYSVERIVTTMYLTSEGIFGPALAAAATLVAMFVILGTFLEKSGASQVFIDLACALGGKRRGGPAKVAVIASALTGSINGSPVANVTTTGIFTIPLMKRIGYKPHVAGAIEANASTGGSILPPIMGAGAFVMAEMAGIPYSTIVTAAIIPAILYYLSLYFVVDFEAAKKNLRGLKDEEVPKLKETLKKGLVLFIPLLVLVYFLVIAKVSVTRAAMFSILAVLIVSFFSVNGRIGFKSLIEILESSAKRMILVSVACAAAGLVVGIITLTGVGLKFSGILVDIGQDSLFLTLILTMIGTIIIGMGLPPTPAYIVFSVLAVPALLKLDIPLLTAHMFVFYFACFAPITPPVCLAAFTAAGISDSHPMRTGLTSFVYALPAFMIPFLFIYGPELMGNGSLPDIVLGVITASIGLLAYAAAIVGWLIIDLKVIERLLLFGGSILKIIPGLVLDTVGFALFLFTLLLIWIRKRNLKTEHNANAESIPSTEGYLSQGK